MMLIENEPDVTWPFSCEALFLHGTFLTRQTLMACGLVARKPYKKIVRSNGAPRARIVRFAMQCDSEFCHRLATLEHARRTPVRVYG